MLIPRDVLHSAPQRGVRVRDDKTSHALPRGQFLGFYQGWVGTKIEAQADLASALPVRSACDPQAIASMLTREYGALRMLSYTAELVTVTSDWQTAQLIVCPVEPGGDRRFVGNILALINDGCADPYADLTIDDVHGSGSGLTNRNDRLPEEAQPLCTAATPPPPSSVATAATTPKDRTANCAFVQILHGGWVYLALTTTRRVAVGEELLLSYGHAHWEAMRQQLTHLCWLRRMQRAVAPSEGRASAPALAVCSRLSAACAACAAGVEAVRMWHNDRGTHRTAERMLCNEDARADRAWRRAQLSGGDVSASARDGGLFAVVTVPRTTLDSDAALRDALLQQQTGLVATRPHPLPSPPPLPPPQPRSLVGSPNRAARGARPFRVGEVVYGKLVHAAAQPAGSDEGDQMANLRVLPLSSGGIGGGGDPSRGCASRLLSLLPAWAASAIVGWRQPLLEMLSPASTSSAASAPHSLRHPGRWWNRNVALHYSCAWRLDDRPRRCALLLDDAQEEYRALMPAGYLDALVRLLAAARSRSVLVIWSSYQRTAPDDGHYGALDEYYGPYGVEGGENPLYLRAGGGAGGARILGELAPRDEAERRRVIESHRFDCFAANDAATGRSRLLGLLASHGVDTLLLAGCWTESCILSTALRAVNEDINTCVVEDAIFSGVSAAPAAHEVLAAYTLMASTSEVASYLEERATPTAISGDAAG